MSEAELATISELLRTARYSSTDLRTSDPPGLVEVSLAQNPSDDCRSPPAAATGREEVDTPHFAASPAHPASYRLPSLLMAATIVHAALVTAPAVFPLLFSRTACSTA